MQKNTLVENIDHVEHSLHSPGFSAMAPLQDTNFPFSVERCTCIALSDVLLLYRRSWKRLSAAL